MNLKFLDRFSQISNFLKIRPMGVELFHADGQTNESNTVIPRLTSGPANEDFFAVFWTRLTNVLVDARANIKHQT